MDPSKYQTLALLTKCPQENTLERLKSTMTGTNKVQLLHAIIGISGESGELSSAMEKHAYYNQPLDEQNVIEELGDLMWYIAEACDALDIKLGYVMSANIEKLKKRYPSKFTTKEAKEQNRDRKKELNHIKPSGRITGTGGNCSTNIPSNTEVKQSRDHTHNQVENAEYSHNPLAMDAQEIEFADDMYKAMKVRTMMRERKSLQERKGWRIFECGCGVVHERPSVDRFNSSVVRCPGCNNDVHPCGSYYDENLPVTPNLRLVHPNTYKKIEH